MGHRDSSQSHPLQDLEQEEFWVALWVKSPCIQGHPGQVPISGSNLKCLVLSGAQQGNEQWWYWFCSSLLLHRTPTWPHLALLSPCLPAFPWFLHIQTLLLLKLKGTSKCPGSLDMLSQHQTLWSVWGCFCQGQSALEVWNSCITGCFSPWHLWAGALPVRIIPGSMDHL